MQEPSISSSVRTWDEAIQSFLCSTAVACSAASDGEPVGAMKFLTLHWKVIQKPASLKLFFRLFSSYSAVFDQYARITYTEVTCQTAQVPYAKSPPNQ